MFSCPHCKNTLISGARQPDAKVSDGVASGVVLYSHCKAILRIEITTLHDPDKSLLESRKMQVKKATTYCMKCHESVVIGNEADHKCIFEEK